MASIESMDLLGMFARIVDLREDEELVQVYSAFQIKVEEIFKNINLPVISGPLETELIDIYSSIWEGFIEGALVVTDQRLVFLRKIKMKRKGVPRKSTRYEIEEMVEIDDLSRFRAKDDLLEVICDLETNPRILFFTSFNKMELKETGVESMPLMMRVSADEVADVVVKLMPPSSELEPDRVYSKPSKSFDECVDARTSVRKYKPDAVSDYIINETLRVGNRAPSAGNLQARDFIIVVDKENKKALANAAFGQKFLAEAPAVIVCCANMSKIEAQYQDRGKELYVLQDVASSVSYMELYLVSKGYGSCWVGCFDEVIVSEILKLPDYVRPIVLLSVGKSGRDRRSKPGRVDIKQLTHRERW
jgi:nitroreductase